MLRIEIRSETSKLFNIHLEHITRKMPIFLYKSSQIVFSEDDILISVSVNKSRVSGRSNETNTLIQTKKHVN